MKKNILIHIGGLGAGGAEKSLVSFLNTLPAEQYNIDLMLLNNTGVFRNQVPEHVNVVEAPFPYNCLGISPSNWKFYIKHNPKYFLKKVCSIFKIRKSRNMPVDQVLWPLWKKSIRTNIKEYDIAVSYLEGLPNYYVIDKVKAKRKILWVHNEYTKLGYDKELDKSYFEQADAVVTISEVCKNDLVRNFPSLEAKFHILENITNPFIVRKMAQETIDDPLFNNDPDVLKLLTIGRFTPQKNYPLAIETARTLKEKGVNFKWYVIGAGLLKNDMEERIAKYSLQNDFVLLGLRTNPYPYIKQCDIVVQSSLFEGKSIAIDEAKILCKPIVTTNYNTVYDVISDGVNGLIAEMTPEAMAGKIIQLYASKNLVAEISANLEKENINNISEIDKYIKVFEQL